MKFGRVLIAKLPLLYVRLMPLVLSLRCVGL